MYEFDSLDRKILSRLREDARKPLLEISKELKVAHGTVNARFRKMQEAGVIRKARLEFDTKTLGFGLTAFIGITVSQAGLHKTVTQSLQKFSEALEVHYTTGQYSLLVKVLLRDIQELHVFLSQKLQTIPGVQSTETFVVLDTAIERPADVTR